MLTIGVGPTFATRWLIPRLADFQKQEPEVEVRFATGGATVPYNDDWTCGIRLGDGDWPGFTAERLFAADLTPVCAPALAKRLRSPDDLRECDAAARRARGDDWPRWFKAVELSKVRAHGPEFEYYGQALQAAADGVGVAMGIRPYVDDDLAGEPAGGAIRAVGVEGRALVPDLSRRPARTSRRSRAFRAWIVRAATRA